MIMFNRFDKAGNYNYASVHWQVFILARKIARFFQKRDMIWASKMIWKRMLMACDHCGALVGMNVTISKFGEACDTCHKELKNKEKSCTDRN